MNASFTRFAVRANPAFALALLLTLFAAGSAHAIGTPEQRKACTPDVYRLDAEAAGRRHHDEPVVLQFPEALGDSRPGESEFLGGLALADEDVAVVVVLAVVATPELDIEQPASGRRGTPCRCVQ